LPLKGSRFPQPRTFLDMDVQAHWGRIYGQKAPDQVSWYRPHLEISLALIAQAAASPSASMIDVGGGQSTVVRPARLGLCKRYVPRHFANGHRCNQETIGARPRSGSVSLFPTSPGWNWSLLPTMCGTTARFSFSCRAARLCRLCPASRPTGEAGRPRDRQRFRASGSGEMQWS